MQAVCRICRSADRSYTPLLTEPRCTPIEHNNLLDADKSMDELLAPCRCRGTMRWVHRGCLEEWRRMSAPGSDTFLRCDMCKTNYRFKASWWRLLLGGEVAVFGYTVVVCGLLFVITVMVAAECRRSLEEVMPLLESELSAHSTLSNEPSFKSFKYPKFIVSFYDQLIHKFSIFTNHPSINVDHFKNIFSGLASLSLIQLLIVDGSVGLSFNLMFSLWRLVHYDFKLDYAISTVFVLIGLGRMVGEVRRVVRVGTARLLTMQIIDYHNDIKCE